MQNPDLMGSLAHIMPAANILLNEPMARHTSFKVGGPADILLLPHTEKECVAAIDILRHSGEPYIVIGNGSNVLVKDGGIRGTVVKLNDGEQGMLPNHEDNTMYAYAGVSLMALAIACANSDLGGCEFASGIPGTVGGAIYMNAGAYGIEMKDIVKSVRLLDENGREKTLSNSQMRFGYRSSAAHDKHMIVLGATFQLEPCPGEQVMENIQDFTKRRNDKQPLMYASAGSTFKRPDGYYAAKLIDEAGLKGFSVGPAEVSTMHAGFIVNKGGATAGQILELISKIQERVFAASGVELDTEVRILGEDA